MCTDWLQFVCRVIIKENVAVRFLKRKQQNI